MLKKILEKIAGKKPQEQKQPELDLKATALINEVQEQSKADPWVGAKLGAKEVFQRLVDAMKNDQGVHIESLLCALGALAGYSCQANLRAQALAKGMPETAAFQIIETKDGKHYFFGEPLNEALAGSEYSVWGLAGGAAQHAGANEFPDLNEIFHHTAAVVGSDQFGVPRVPDNHQASDTPINYLKALWPSLLQTVKLFCPNPADWPVLYGLAIQEAIEAGKSAIDSSVALKIVMESAIPMSKVDLAAPQTSAHSGAADRELLMSRNSPHEISVNLQDLIDSRLNNASRDSSGLAIVVMGPIAAGKTTHRKTLLRDGFVHIDSADIFHQLSAGDASLNFPDAFAQEIEFIGRSLTAAALEQKMNVVVEIVGHDADEVVNLIEAMKSIGYRVEARSISCDRETCEQQNATRGDNVSSYYAAPIHYNWIVSECARLAAP
jgi:hypothetical protein